MANMGENLLANMENLSMSILFPFFSFYILLSPKDEDRIKVNKTLKILNNLLIILLSSISQICL